MSSQAQNMNILYCDLFANSPKTVTMDLSSDVGFEYISQVVTKRGTVFSDWHIKYNSDMVIHGPCSEEFIQIMFCMSEGVSWNIADRHSVFHFRQHW